jgi:hypothetical protein
MVSKKVWVMSNSNLDHFIDITSTFNKKIKALHSHVDQADHTENLEFMVLECGEENAQAYNSQDGSAAEVFKIVRTN